MVCSATLDNHKLSIDTGTSGSNNPLPSPDGNIDPPFGGNDSGVPVAKKDVSVEAGYMPDPIPLFNRPLTFHLL